MSPLDSGEMALSSFVALPGNAKDHDIGLISESMERFGYIERVVINRTTGHILSGHGRIETLRRLRADGQEPPDGVFDNSDNTLPDAPPDEWLVPVDYVRLAERDEAAASLSLNQAVIRGGWDTSALTDMLEDLAKRDPEKGLIGTGFDRDDLDLLLADKHFSPPPPAPPPELERRFGILLEVRDRIAENRLADLLAKYGYEDFLRLSEE